MTARQITAVAPYQVVLKETDFQEPGKNEALIKSEYSLTNTGTELAVFTGLDAELSETFAYPVVQGRTNIGTIEKLGKGLDDLSLGDFVLSFGPHASHFVIRRDLIVSKVPADIEPQTACFARMAAVSISAVRSAELTAGDQVLILGQGIVGNMSAQLFQISGAQVMVVDLSDSRLEVSRQCGISNAINPTNVELKAAVSGWTEGRGPRIVIEAVGEPELIRSAVDLVAKHGQVILLGTPRKSVAMDLGQMLLRIHADDITLKGSYLWDVPNHPTPRVQHSVSEHVSAIFNWLRDGLLTVKPLLTHVYSPDQCQEAYERMQQDKDGCQSVLFDWRQENEG